MDCVSKTALAKAILQNSVSSTSTTRNHLFQPMRKRVESLDDPNTHRFFLLPRLSDCCSRNLRADLDVEKLTTIAIFTRLVVHRVLGVDVSCVSIEKTSYSLARWFRYSSQPRRKQESARRNIGGTGLLGTIAWPVLGDLLSCLVGATGVSHGFSSMVACA